jgi:hypothetical protein
MKPTSDDSWDLGCAMQHGRQQVPGTEQAWVNGVVVDLSRPRGARQREHRSRKCVVLVRLRLG